MLTGALLLICFFIGVLYIQRRRRKQQEKSDAQSAPAVAVQAAADNPPPAPALPPAQLAGGAVMQATQPEPAATPGTSRSDYEKSRYYAGAVDGKAHCNGLKCNPEVECRYGERQFCRDIIQKWNRDVGKAWIGQYCVNLDGQWRRVDFAVKTSSGKVLAIEVDGYKYHARLTEEKFQDQLDRQNEFAVKGWGVLHFSYSDMTERADKCVNAISRAVHSQNQSSTAAFKPRFFARVHPTPEQREQEPRPAMYSNLLKGWYILVDDIFSSHPQFADCGYYAPCPNADCTGRIWRDNAGKFHNWTCDSCGRKFFDKDEGRSLPVQELISRKTNAGENVF